MARIPGYESQDTEVPVAPRYSRVQADPQAFGAGLGPAIQHAAAGSAGEFAQEFERERRDNDTIQVNYLVDESSRAQGAAKLRLLKEALGPDAAKGANAVLASFEEAGGNIAKRAQNEDQRKHFQLRWMAQRTELEKAAAAHVLEQNDLLDKSTTERMVLAQNERMAADPHAAAADFLEPDPAKSPIAMLNGQLDDAFMRWTGSPAEAANGVRKIREDQALFIVKSLLAKAHQDGYGAVQDFLDKAGGALGAHLPALQAQVNARMGNTKGITLGRKAAKDSLSSVGLVDPVKARSIVAEEGKDLSAEDQNIANAEAVHEAAAYRQRAEQRIDLLAQEAQKLWMEGDAATKMPPYRNPATWKAIGGRPAELAQTLLDKRTYHGPETMRMMEGWWRARQHSETTARQLPSAAQTERWSFLSDEIARGNLVGMPIEKFVAKWLRGVDANGEPLLAEPDYRATLAQYTAKVATKSGAAMPRDSADQLLVIKAMEDMGIKRPVSKRGGPPLDLADIPLDSTFGAVHTEVWSEFQTWRKAHQEATDKEAVEEVRGFVKRKKAEAWISKEGTFYKNFGFWPKEALGAEARQRQSLQNQGFQPAGSTGKAIVLPPARVVPDVKDIPTQVRDKTGGIVDPRLEIRLYYMAKYKREPSEPEILMFYNANVGTEFR